MKNDLWFEYTGWRELLGRLLWWMVAHLVVVVVACGIFCRFEREFILSPMIAVFGLIFGPLAVAEKTVGPGGREGAVIVAYVVYLLLLSGYLLATKAVVRRGLLLLLLIASYFAVRCFYWMVTASC